MAAARRRRPPPCCVRRSAARPPQQARRMVLVAPTSGATLLFGRPLNARSCAAQRRGRRQLSAAPCATTAWPVVRRSAIFQPPCTASAHGCRACMCARWEGGGRRTGRRPVAVSKIFVVQSEILEIRTPQNPLPMLNTLSSVSVRESRVQYLCDPRWFRDTASRGPTTIVAPESQFRNCPTDHGCFSGLPFWQLVPRSDQFREETGTSRPDEIGADGFSSSSWPEQIPAREAAAAACTGGGGVRFEEKGAAASCSREVALHPHHRDFIITPIADQIGSIDSVSKTEYYDLKNHFSEPQCKMTVLPLNSGKSRFDPC
ncbi:hypothetical protein F511_22954 [Dorcoceras hygrometricum]|uniref:Uncharacterized protein n=1 Tax=Dorcoceras hygrometricum TaxID=472368 RepID=A0A2Z7AYK2_9LAMI|nr:hypothetical protein F511_22954 [Dorcoceras hygrometricum]